MKRINLPNIAFALLPLLPTTAADLGRSQSEPAATAVKTIGLFEALDAGQIEAKFIPVDATRANVLIANLTDRAVHLELPEAIAAVPVLGQVGGQGFGGQFGGQQFGGQGMGQAGGGGSQGVGGGFNSGGNQGFGNGFMGGQRNGMGGPGGFMRIAPEKTRKLKATTVCLEHGKPEPNPRLAYRMIPVDQFTNDNRIATLCARLGRGEIPQNTAQAVAWHLANGLSWEEISKINRIESRYLGNIRMFRPGELKAAKKAAESINAMFRSESESSSSQ